MSILNKLEQIEQAVIYSSATLSTPNDKANKNDKTVSVHKGRSFSAENQLNHAEENLNKLKPIIQEMIEVIDALQGSSGQWAEQWLNDLAKKCSEISTKIEEV